MSLPPSEDAIREAERFMAKKIAGSLTARDEKALEAWLDDPRNRQAFEELRRAAALTDGFEEELLAEDFEAELFEEAARADAARSRFVSRRRMGFGALAAGIAAAVAVVFPLAPATLSYTTGTGETTTVNLADGSVMTLATRSAAEVSIGADMRRVELMDGEAFFDVEKDPGRPFVVTTAQGDITVTGTSFNVKLRPGATALSVVSGAVQATHRNGDREILLAGEAITFEPDTGLTGKYAFDASKELAWRVGRLRFEDTPVTEVVREVNRYRQTPILLHAGVDGGATVTGEFTDLTGETAPRAIAAALDLELVRKEAVVVLQPAGDSEGP